MQAKRLSVQLRTRPRGDGATTHLVPAPPWWPTWSCEPRGTRGRLVEQMAAVPELGRQLALPPLLGPLQARVSGALREGGGGLRAATTGRCWIPPPLPVHLVHRALPRTTGRAPPAGRSAHKEGGFPSTSTNALTTHLALRRAIQETNARGR